MNVLCGTWKPRIAPLGESKPQGLPIAIRDWDVGKSESHIVTMWIPIETVSGAKAS